MARMNIEFFSKSLLRNVQVRMYIPNDRRDGNYEGHDGNVRMRTLLLLHGYTDSPENWVPEYLAAKYNFAIVIPNGENGFWLNGLSTGHRYEDYIAVELIEYIRKTFKLAMNADETYVMGYSMGGFGALHTALAHPENFGKAAALSSALIVHKVAKMKPEDRDGFANYDYYRECFGDPGKVEKSRNNPEFLVSDLLKNGTGLPQIYMACGTEDFLLNENREFHKYLTDINVSHEYFETKGGHDFTFWGEYAVKMCDLMFS